MVPFRFMMAVGILIRRSSSRSRILSLLLQTSVLSSSSSSSSFASCYVPSLHGTKPKSTRSCSYNNFVVARRSPVSSPTLTRTPISLVPLSMSTSSSSSSEGSASSRRASLPTIKQVERAKDANVANFVVAKELGMLADLVLLFRLMFSPTLSLLACVRSVH